MVKHKTEGKRLTRKLTALRQDAWRLMHELPATQHEWLAAALRGHYDYHGRPHNYPALNGFYREVRRAWIRCLRRRGQKSRRMGWSEFENPGGTLPSARSTHHSHMGAGADMTRVTLGKSRVRESRMLGSVRAKLNGRATRHDPTETDAQSHAVEQIRSEAFGIPQFRPVLNKLSAAKDARQA